MSYQDKQTGRRGEQMALIHLEGQGYVILEQNYRTKLGEIDIIACDREVVCFIEVKTRTSIDFGRPGESITRSKRQKMIQSAWGYLKFKKWENRACRFDVVSIILGKGGQMEVEII